MFSDIFPTLHVGAVIMHAIVIVFVYYRIPLLEFFPQSKTFFIEINALTDPLMLGSSRGSGLCFSRQYS
jgi:hypothetical protein